MSVKLIKTYLSTSFMMIFRFVTTLAASLPLLTFAAPISFSHAKNEAVKIYRDHPVSFTVAARFAGKAKRHPGSGELRLSST